MFKKSKKKRKKGQVTDKTTRFEIEPKNNIKSLNSSV